MGDVGAGVVRGGGSGARAAAFDGVGAAAGWGGGAGGWSGGCLSVLSLCLSCSAEGRLERETETVPVFVASPTASVLLSLVVGASTGAVAGAAVVDWVGASS